ncbi:iron chelate uptake ABC transporter family permease subunit [Neisseriaceae bacterium CLB008]|nr:iron chelate uptake ABC transporter family permease subunit [Neisseriaceae bacterium]
MGPKRKLGLLALLAVITMAGYLFYELTSWDYALPRRAMVLVAMAIAGTAIAFSTVIFQTVTHNRILTPSVMGLDSLYLLVQTVLVFFFGTQTVVNLSSEVQFFMSIGIMVCFSILLYQLMFRGEGKPIYFLLLVGIILGTLFQSLSSFMQVLIDPNEFLIVQDKMFASFNNVQVSLVWWSIALMVVTMGGYMYYIKYLDVLSLGREQSVNLGVSYEKVVRNSLVLVAILTSLATALVGPITFLGLLVANLSYEILKTYRHRYLLLGAILISMIALAGGQMLVERVFTFSTTLSVIVNFVGGLYFIYLLLRENRSW